MKKIKCESCGSNELEKVGNEYICKFCKTKYSLEDVQRIIVEGNIDISGSKVKIDKSSDIENFIARAEEFAKNKEFEKAEEYYNKALDLDAKNEIAKKGLQELRNVYIGPKKITRKEYLEIEKLLKKGDKVAACKAVKDATNLSLVDSKDWVDNYTSYDITVPEEIKKNEQKSGGCYIATCVYGSYDCSQVWTLRRYRDHNLAKTWHGRLFIKIYYAISPKIVKMFGNKKWFKKIWRNRLDNMVKKLQQKGYEASPYDDVNW